MRIEELRLGFVGDRCAFVDDHLWVDAGVGRVLEALAARCSRITLALAESPRHEPLQDMRLSLPVADYVPLPWLTTIARGFHKAWSCRRAIREVERRSDAVIVQLPFAAPFGTAESPPAPLVSSVRRYPGDGPQVERLWRIPPRAGAGGRPFFRSPSAAPARRAGRPGDHQRQARSSAHYGHAAGRAVVSTTILDREIQSVPRRRPPDAPFRVLYIGYLRMAKGIDTLFAAFDQVLDRIPNAELVIVGVPLVVDDGVESVVREGLAHLARKGTVRQVGHVNFGPELFQQYADADVLALPSRSEGTPRVLVEARAFGCPVIATRVGGIPTSVTDGVDGVLVEVEDVAALRDAILRVAGDREFRQQLIDGGLSRARESTVESFAAAMIGEIEQLMEEVPVPC